MKKLPGLPLPHGHGSVFKYLATNRTPTVREGRSWILPREDFFTVASATGSSPQTLNAIETGRYDRSLPLAFQLAEVFGMRIEEIFRPARASLTHQTLSLIGGGFG